MANTSRSISRACGKASNKSRSDPSGYTEKGQHVELASKKKEIGQHVELAGKKNEIGQHVELASKKKSKKVREANTLSWPAKKHYMRCKAADL